MILSLQTIRDAGIISPWCERSEFKGRHGVLTYGASSAGYDIRAEFDSKERLAFVELRPGGFRLASTVERFTMPTDVVGIVHDKSSWARRGLCVQNTVIEPGWCGYLTLELTNHGVGWLHLERGVPLAQVVFHRLDKPSERPYTGKYQDQARGPQEAK